MKSIRDRQHKMSIGQFGAVQPDEASVAQVVANMPQCLAADSLRKLAAAIKAARDDGSPVVFALGGHVVKTGCSNYIIDLCRRGFVTHLALNGAAAIHDVEIAIHGETSEDVDDTLGKGEFGMVAETTELFDAACQACSSRNIGLGAGLVNELADLLRTPRAASSLLWNQSQVDAGSVTVHAAIGADTVHLSDDLDGAALGKALLTDFRAVCKIVFGLQGGVWVNVGSATLLPEVFLKAISSALHAGAELDRITTADMDMIRHYRPTQNVVRRPPGHGLQITGHHEIMLPLLHQLLVSPPITGDARL